MKPLLFFILLLYTNTLQGQNTRFEGTIVYEVRENEELTAIEDHYFKDNKIRIEHHSLNESRPSFTYIHYFHGTRIDSIYKAIGSHVHYNPDSNLYNLDIYPKWTDMVASVAELPHQDQKILQYNCEAIEVNYKLPEGIARLAYLGQSIKSHIIKRWLSSDLNFQIPEGNYFNWGKYMVAYYDSRLPLKSIATIEYDDDQMRTVTKTAIEIQPGKLSNRLFTPNRITNKMSLDFN